MSDLELTDDGTMDTVITCTACDWERLYNPEVDTSISAEGDHRVEDALEMAAEDHECRANHVFAVTIALDGAAFEENSGAELAYVLRDLATRVENATPGAKAMGGEFPVMDVNGNRVGEAEIKEQE